jgi:hypothetical protein
MPLSEEEINQVKSGLESGQDLSTLEFLKPVAEAGVFLTTAASIKTNTDNATQKAIDERTSEWATKIEGDILESTGIPKEANEKYYQYYKRAIGAVKGDPTKVTTLEAQIAELKKGGSNIDAAITKELEELKLSIPIANENHTKELARLKGEASVYVKTNEINKGFAGFKAKEGIPDTVVAREKAWAIKQLLEMPNEIRDIDGIQSIAWLDDKGHAIRNDDNSVKTPEQMVNGLLADIKAEERGGAGGGAGGSGSGSGGAGANNDFSIEIPDTITNMEDLDTYLKQKGIVSGSDEYGKIHKYYKTEKKLPLSARFGTGRK